jgi:hypothetical protein
MDAAEKTLEQMITEAPEGTMFALTGLLKSFGTPATMDELRQLMAADTSPLGVAYSEWFFRKGLGDDLDRMDQEYRRIYAASGSELVFVDWAQQMNAELKVKGEALEKDPAFLAQFLETAERLAEENGGKLDPTELIKILFEEHLGPGYGQLAAMSLEFGTKVQDQIDEAMADAKPELGPLEYAAARQRRIANESGPEIDR